MIWEISVTVEVTLFLCVLMHAVAKKEREKDRKNRRWQYRMR